jgi:lysophospholipase L1-like esterase
MLPLMALLMPAATVDAAPAPCGQKDKKTDLPTVLIIGDSISLGYTPHVKEMLKDEAQVLHNRGNAQHTGTGLKKLDSWLGKKKWDVIHFNWGLRDPCYRNPESKTQGNRDKVNGKLTFTPEEYEANLRKLVARLKKTGSKLIWCHTTPVPEGEAGRHVGDGAKYNAIAAKIMKEHNIPVNDLHARMLPVMKKYQTAPGNVHFTKEGSRFLAEQVAAKIREQLAK